MTETRKVGRRTIKLSNPTKVLFPDAGFTKVDLVDYYEAVAPVMVPHVKDRLMTLERYPDGVEGEKFYSKNIPRYFPDWIARKTVGKKGGTVTHVVCNEPATLVYLANQACITPHVSLFRVDRLDRPDQLMLDLDPSLDDFREVRRVAKDVRALLEELGLFSVVKSSGSRGLHVVVPLDRSCDIAFVRQFAHDLAALAAARDPERVTIESSKADRKDRLYLDWLRNSFGQHAVAPYGVRARARAPVAMPLDWSEVEKGKLDPQQWTIKSAIRRVADGHDPWKGWRRRARSLTEPRRRLDALLDEVPV